jgi:hypothetical protein
MAVNARAWAGTFSWERCVDESLALFTRAASTGVRPARKAAP